MRFFMKGGVWKNSEDEILKAAVMKYGKCQWARVASLLPRKTAKNCKARWYEWLDPSIKKTEWTRDEEERLLHLAKLMPSQWRTIAPLVGRTATQCLEHYERLLDAAQDKTYSDPRDDPRRLQPGEIDPTPEAKPARPDPVDMDEDEKEMLSEARARLANTRGKKAKRKAREKQLEEARRLASLQKRRELKAAGITLNRKRARNKRDMIDYATEIPFQKPVPAGVFDTSAEDERMRAEKADPEFLAKRLHELEDERRDREESKARAADKRRMKTLAKANLPMVVAMTASLNDPEQARKRSRLVLPAPQVSEGELEEIAKAGLTGASLAAEAAAKGSAATRALIGQYAATPLAAPTQTPRITAEKDTILQEARNLIALTSGETPLKGGANPELAEGTGFSGATPMSHANATPNVLLSGMAGAGAGAGGRTPMATPGATPARSGFGGAQGPGATPLRDELSINNGGGDLGSMADRAQQSLSGDLASAFMSLPEPQYSYEVVPPEEEPEMNEESQAVVEEDAADIEAREAAARKAAEEAEFRQRSEALKRTPQLPRPAVIDADAIATPLEEGTDPAIATADSLIMAEMALLLRHDNAKFPLKSHKPSRKTRRPVNLEPMSEAERAAAADLILEETEAVKVELEVAAGGAISTEAWSSAMANRPEVVFVPSKSTYAERESLTPALLVEALSAEFKRLQEALAKDAKRVAKAEARLTTLTTGLERRAAAALSSLTKSAAELDDKRIQLKCFKMLRDAELAAMPSRLSVSTAELNDLTEAENELQARYARLTREMDDLRQGQYNAVVAATVAEAAAGEGASSADGSTGAGAGAGAGADAGAGAAAGADPTATEVGAAGAASPSKGPKMDVEADDANDENGDGAAGTVALALDLKEDCVSITNTTSSSLSLKGWQLCSDVGTQTFDFPDDLALDSGATVTVWSGRSAKKHEDPPRHLFWTRQYIWNNDGDTAVVKNSEGAVVASVTETPPPVSIELDLIKESVVITNTSGKSLPMKGFVLSSDVGHQKFEFPEDLVLKKNGKTTVWSGKDAAKHGKAPRNLVWTKQFVWNNAGDTAVVFDAEGKEVARVTVTPEESS